MPGADEQLIETLRTPLPPTRRDAARIFGADNLFFVTNGTSTSNKIVWHYVVAPDDVVIVDRNCHKSVLHAITMTGAVPGTLGRSLKYNTVRAQLDLEVDVARAVVAVDDRRPAGELQRRCIDAVDHAGAVDHEHDAGRRAPARGRSGPPAK